MSRKILIPLIAVLLLMVVGAEAFACDLMDPCFSSVAEGSGGCDQPSGDNCMCCCQHIVPATILRVIASEYLSEAIPLPPAAHAMTMALPIEHPPQL
ncbi:hypothetical protein [Paludibaculum fermentans]|uniref:hypothetical protein n=1 Tax=Paludibaculum fermentans TaxID=1473598 RepID=UPI003EB7780D